MFPSLFNAVVILLPFLIQFFLVLAAKIDQFSLKTFLNLQQQQFARNYRPSPHQQHKPEKLIGNCPRELLQTSSFRQFPLLCRTQPSLAIVAYEGILDAMEECRRHMRFERWDCSQPATVVHEPTILRHAYRESAYLWAMSAAGVAWGVATACAQGWLEECKCANGANSGAGAEWEWSGCSYGIQYGVVTSRKLLTRTNANAGHVAGGQIFRRLEKHNMKVGRMAVKRTLTSSCRCHGVSGSCQLKTCWKKTADLRAVSKHLKEKYRRARQVNSLTVGGGVNVRNTELAFLDRGVDLCSQFHYDVHQKRSLPRICSWRNATHSEGNCTDICCGLGYSVSHEVVPYKCDCKFVWCCRLECRECLEHRWISTCNT